MRPIEIERERIEELKLLVALNSRLSSIYADVFGSWASSALSRASRRRAFAAQEAAVVRRDLPGGGDEIHEGERAR
jgi:hypothetical protein